VWRGAVRKEVAERILSAFSQEIDKHKKEQTQYGHNIAYCADVAYRIGQRSIVGEEAGELVSRAKTLLQRAAELYPSIGSYHVADGLAPAYESIINEVEAKNKDIKRRSTGESDSQPISMAVTDK
jgi:hypothetical protein